MNASLLTRVLTGALVLGLSISVPAQTDYSQPYVVSTVAGISNVGSIDGTGEAARFNRPEGIARDAAGNLYIADTRNHTIRKITPSGVVTTLAGSPGKQGIVDGAGAAARFSLPGAIVVNGAGVIYVVDFDGQLIRKITPEGNVTTLAGNENGGRTSQDGTGTSALFRRVSSLVLDSAGNILASDLSSRVIPLGLLRRITPNGEVTTLSANPGDDFRENDPAFGVPTLLKDTKFQQISGLAFDNAGNLYIGQSTQRAVLKLGTDGYVRVVAGKPGDVEHVDGPGSSARFGNITALAADGTGAVYVVDRYYVDVRKISPTGEVSTWTTTPFQFGATGVVSDSAGNLFFTYESKVVAINSALKIADFAGLDVSKSVGDADGVAVNARFSVVDGVAVGAGGVIYVADDYNHTVRKISVTGEVTTLAGKAGESGFVDGLGSAARFNRPCDLVVDVQGNVYVADMMNRAIRRIAIDGTVTTLSKVTQTWSDFDGPTAAEKNTYPLGIAWGANANELLVADGFKVRRVSLSGDVTVLGGTIAQSGSLLTDAVMDSAGSIYGLAGATLFKWPASGAMTTLSTEFNGYRLAAASSGEIFLTERNSGVARIGKLRADGTVEIVAGLRNVYGGFADGKASDAIFSVLGGIAVGENKTLFVGGGSTVRKASLALAPVITAQPQAQVVVAGGAAQFTVVATSEATPTYQWNFNGNPIAGATSATYSIASVQSANVGSYTVVVTNSTGSVTSNVAALTISAGTPQNPGGGSGSGGGGAPSHWFAVALVVLGLARRWSDGRERILN